MEEARRAFKIQTRKSTGKRPLGSPKEIGISTWNWVGEPL